MSRIVFQPDLPVTPVDPTRTDVACFVGLVRIRSIVPEMVHAEHVGDADLPLSQVQASAKLRVFPGEIIPVDGTVTDGWSFVDQTPSVSEDALIKVGVDPADPKEKQAQAVTAVQAGARNISGMLTIEASRAGGQVAALPDSKRDWLRVAGWLDGPYARNCDALFDVPIPIENFAAFQALYDDGTSAAAVGTDYLALAVQSYFAQGGKRCYVVRMGDAITMSDDRNTVLEQLLAADAAPGDQGSWHGMAHLWGLPDISFLVVPDLPLLHARKIDLAKAVTEDLSSGPEQFVPCVPPPAAPDEKRVFALPAPRLAANDYNAWGETVRTIAQRLADKNNRLREVQLVAAMPMPLEDPITPALMSPAESEANSVQSAIASVFAEDAPGTALGASSAFVQIAYPWLRSTRSGTVLEGLEPPDGTLAGMLARNALLNGTFTSATKITPVGLFDLFPELPAQETEVPMQKPLWQNGVRKPLVLRFSLFGFTPSGIRLLSDVTTYPEEAYRPAPVNRLVSLLSRSARLFGEQHIFENNGPALWRQLEQTLRSLLKRLWELNALDGASPADAFDVHCDRTTMTQYDVDNGRLIAIVRFQPAASLELITVTLTVEGGTATNAEVDAQMLGVA